MEVLKIFTLFLSTPVALFTEKLNLDRQKKRFNKGKVQENPEDTAKNRTRPRIQGRDAIVNTPRRSILKMTACKSYFKLN